MNTLHVKKGDTVVVRTGDHKGKSGVVSKAFPKTGMVLVEGVNLKKRHQKSRAKGQSGQMIEVTHPISASKVVKK